MFELVAPDEERKKSAVDGEPTPFPWEQAVPWKQFRDQTYILNEISLLQTVVATTPLTAVVVPFERRHADRHYDEDTCMRVFNNGDRQYGTWVLPAFCHLAAMRQSVEQHPDKITTFLEISDTGARFFIGYLTARAGTMTMQQLKVIGARIAQISQFRTVDALGVDVLLPVVAPSLTTYQNILRLYGDFQGRLFITDPHVVTNGPDHPRNVIFLSQGQDHVALCEI